jgi:hypothetical protein
MILDGKGRVDGGDGGHSPVQYGVVGTAREYGTD